MTTTQVQNSTDVLKAFFLEHPEGEEQQLFIEEMGTLVFQSALMQQMTIFSEAEAKSFEDFINNNIAEDSFIDALCAEYPSFQQLLLKEMSALSSEVKEIFVEEKI
jgi:hypothetical protein